MSIQDEEASTPFSSFQKHERFDRHQTEPMAGKAKNSVSNDDDGANAVRKEENALKEREEDKSDNSSEIESQRVTIHHLRQRVHHLEHELQTLKKKKMHSRRQTLPSHRRRKMLVKGGVFLKHGRRGYPKPRVVWVTPDFKYVCWRPVGHGSKFNDTFQKNKLRRMEIAMISNVITGASSDVFSRSSTCLDFASFTLMTKSRERTLDLEVQHADVSTDHGAQIIKEERNAWVEAFEDLLSEFGSMHNDDSSVEEESGRNLRHRVSDYLQ